MELILSGLEWLPLTDECWSRAAALGFNLRRAGIAVPLTDRLVVVTARMHDASSYTATLTLTSSGTRPI